MTDSLSEWRTKAAERAAQRNAREAERSMSAAEQAQWTAWIESHLHREWEEQVWPNLEALADEVGKTVAELRAKIHELEIQMAELRGMRQAQQVAHDTGLIGVDGTKLVRPNGNVSH
jgi:hypothetical protein